MPKAQCSTCHLSTPVQLLALHAQECEPGSCSDSIDSKPAMSTVIPQLTMIYSFLIITLFQNVDPDMTTDFDESPALSNHGSVSLFV